METTVARIKLDEMQIAGEINERLPAVTSGLVAHYPFDGTLESIKTVSSAKVLAYGNINGRPWYNWFSTNAGSFTDCPDLTAVTIDQAKQYDLVVADDYVWATSSTVMNKLKSFADAGVSVVAVGNDTAANCFVLSKSGSAHIAHNVVLEEDLPFKTNVSTLTSGSSDLYGGIDSLVPQAYPIYRRSDTNQITGYIYEGINGGALYYDLEGTIGISSSFHIQIFNYILGKSIGSMTNTTLDYDGIAVEEATTNLVITKGWSCEGAKNISLPIYQGLPVTPVITSYVPNGDWKDLFSVTISQVLANGSSLTVSGWFFCKHPQGAFNCQLNDSLNNNRGIGTTTATKGWNYLKWTYTNTSGTEMTINSIRVEAQCTSTSLWTNNDNEAWGCNYQIELKPFPTSFTNGTRSPGRVDISLSRLETYTVFGCFVPDSPFKNDSNGYTTTANQSALIRIEDTIKVGGFYHRFYLSGSVTSAPFIDPDGYYGTSHIHQTYEIEALKPIYFAIRKSGTQAKLKLYQNTWKAEHVLTVPSDAGLDMIRFGDSTIWNGTYNNLSIYNRSLDDNELNNLIKTNLSANSSGDINSLTLIERPNNTPIDTRYFPLSNDSYDEYNLIDASTKTNIDYSNSMLWVGQSTSNLFTNQTTAVFTNAYNGTNYSFGAGTDLQQIVELPQIHQDSMTTKVSRITGGTSQSDYVYIGISSPLNSTKIVSFWYYGTYGTSISPYNNDGCASIYFLDNYGIWQGGNTTQPVPVETYKWQKITLKIVNKGVTAGTGLTWCILHSNGTTATLSNREYWKFTALQVEDKTFDTPFVAGSRGDGTLIIPTAGLIGSNSTVIISYIPKTNISSTVLSNAQFNSKWWGVYHNTSGQIYMHEGSTGASSNSGIVATLNQLNQVAVSWNDTTQYLYVNGVLKSSLATVGATNAANIPNLYIGYGWNRGNAFYRDLIMVPRTLTGDEIAAIYKTPISVSNSNLQVTNTLSEGISLT